MTAPMTPERRAEIEARLKAEQGRLNALHNLHTGDLDIRLQTIVSAAQMCLAEIDRLNAAVAGHKADDDMAEIGRALLERIAECRHKGSEIEHWMPADSPVEIVTDLLNMLHDTNVGHEAAIDAAVLAEREACAAHLEAHALELDADVAKGASTVHRIANHHRASVLRHAAAYLRARSEAKP